MRYKQSFFTINLNRSAYRELLCTTTDKYVHMYVCISSFSAALDPPFFGKAPSASSWRLDALHISSSKHAVLYLIDADHPWRTSGACGTKPICLDPYLRSAPKQVKGLLGEER